ncbi:N-acetyltransferase [Kiritimatiellaeota bacterium B1221]|nr:N-acetyltransferase [Kiritimatiellaeota bacterium B1221]
MKITLRPENKSDLEAIDDLLNLAFAFDPHSHQNEGAILQRLRESRKLLLSLVAIDESGELVGQIAFSPVEIDDGSPEGTQNWIGLGPMSVNPRLQRMGIGRQLIETGLKEMKSREVSGCVVLGEPGFYERFGFNTYENLILPGALAPFFMARAFNGEVPGGIVHYDPAFSTD